MFIIRVKKFLHRDKYCLGLFFDFNSVLVNLLRTIPDSRWSKTYNCWCFLFHDKWMEQLQTIFKGVALIIKDFDDSIKDALVIHEKEQVNPIVKKQKSIVRVLAKPIPEHIVNEKLSALQKYDQWLKHRRYSDNTISTYMDGIKQFLRFFIEKPLDDITNDDIVFFNNKYIIENGYSISYQTQIISSIKLFFSRIKDRKLIIENIFRPRREHKLPNVLSKKEVLKILSSLKNIKHITMLSLIYACGLRRSELMNLKSEDVDSKRFLLIIRNAKGKKDRIVPVSEKILDMLRNYYKMYQPKVWLFEGQQPGTQYSEGSLQNVLKLAKKKARIFKPVTLHWLRHSYATHLLESGTDLRYIQELLGHKSSRTTEIYTHVSIKNIQNIKSPFDDL